MSYLQDVQERSHVVRKDLGKARRLAGLADCNLLVRFGYEDAIASSKLADIRSDLDHITNHGVAILHRELEGLIGKNESSLRIDRDSPVDPQLSSRADGGGSSAYQDPIAGTLGHGDFLEGRLPGTVDHESLWHLVLIGQIL